MLQRGATDKKAFVHYKEFAATATAHGRRTATVGRDNRHRYGYDATANKVSPFDNIALTPLQHTASEPSLVTTTTWRYADKASRETPHA